MADAALVLKQKTKRRDVSDVLLRASPKKAVAGAVVLTSNDGVLPDK
jgi:hypothetical protein